MSCSAADQIKSDAALTVSLANLNSNGFLVAELLQLDLCN